MENNTLNRNILVLLLLVFISSIVVFESLQQLFYIRQFNLANANDISFFRILKSQSYRWITWLLVGTLLWFFAKKKSVKTKFVITDLFQYLGVILLLVFFSILIISLLEKLLNGSSFSDFISNYIPFFTFQKALVFTIGYTAVAVFLHFYFANEKLQIKVHELSEIRKENMNLYEKLKSNIDDQSPVLNIKIGNKRKIIPIKSISWIESDDYCVKVHTDDYISYSMRSTLKLLEKKLSNSNFLRIHRKALVNMSKAKEIDFSNSPKLILEDKIEVPISKSKLKKVKDFLD